MGNKVNPVSFRLYSSKKWKNIWFSSNKDTFAKNVFEDVIVRKIVDDYYKNKPVSDLIISRYDNVLNVTVKTDRANALIGSKGIYVEELRNKLSVVSLSKDINVIIEEYKTITPRYIVDIISNTLEQRGNYRKVIKRLENQLNRMNLRGYKILLNGRLDGSEKTRTFRIQNGKLPLSTISSKVDYYFRAAHAKYGIIGVKSWICTL